MRVQKLVIVMVLNLIFMKTSFAAVMYAVPVEFIRVDNMVRAQFLESAMNEVSPESIIGLKYKNFISSVGKYGPEGGDLFLSVELVGRNGMVFKCAQSFSVSIAGAFIRENTLRCKNVY